MIYILGNGYIGQRINADLKYPIIPRKILFYQDIENIIHCFHPKVLINCIGYSGLCMEDCEKHKATSLFANTYLPIMLAEACQVHHVKLVHISTGCIYKSGQDITEEVSPDFYDMLYPRSKISAEACLKQYPDVLILRIRLPLDPLPHPKNLLTKLINYRKVIDQFNSVTYLPDFARALEHLIKIDACGIYHVVNKDGLWYLSLMETYRKYNLGFKYGFTKSTHPNLILSVDKLESSGFKIRSIYDVLDECVEGYVKKTQE